MEKIEVTYSRQNDYHVLKSTDPKWSSLLAVNEDIVDAMHDIALQIGETMATDATKHVDVSVEEMSIIFHATAK